MSMLLQCAVCQKEIPPGESREISGKQLAASLQTTYELAKDAGLSEEEADERLFELRGAEKQVICAKCNAVLVNAGNVRGYWIANMSLIGVLLAIWAAVSYGCGILFIEKLNEYKIGELPLGFWFSQQGSIFVFVVLIFIYAFSMDRLDRRFGVRE